MPFPNEHSARIKDPGDFQKDSFRRKNIAPGVDLVTGKLTGEETLTEQSYRFDTSSFSADEAKNWLKNNNKTYSNFEPAANDKVVEGHIFAYGEVIPWQDTQADEYGCINLKSIVNQIKQNSEATRLVVHVHSPGGDVYEGFAIHDALVNSGKEVETVIEGLCASIATVIALAGDKRLMTSHSEFMIHNPWTFAVGDSEDLKKQADDLSKIENKLAGFYAAKTNLTSEQLLEYMHAETFFTVDQAQEFGFITESVNTMKQVAHYKQHIKNNMTNEETTKKLSGIEALLNKVVAFFSPKNLMVQDVNGKELDFGPEIETPEQIVVGVKATVDGVPAEGDYTMASGEVYKFAAGVLSEIVPVDADEPDAEKEQLKAELAEAQKQLAEATNKLETVSGEMVKFKAEFAKFKAEFSTGDPAGHSNPDGGDPPAKRKAFK